MASAERIRRVDQHDVQVATEFEVLKAIIENEPLHPAPQQLPAPMKAIPANPESNPMAQPRFEQLDFVARAFDRRSLRSSGEGGLATVSPRENAHALPLGEQ